MNWLARLKKISAHTGTDATKATKPIHDLEIGGFVGFVAPTLACIEKIKGDPAAANDTAPAPKLAAIVQPIDAQKAEQETFTPPADPATVDPDRWCWPHTTAMTGAEIDTFMARLARFTDKGLTLDDGEALADKLVTRDRESDDRRLCLECLHLAGHGAGSWRCSDWQRAGIAIRVQDNLLPRDLVLQLKRCDALPHQFNPQKAHHD